MTVPAAPITVGRADRSDHADHAEPRSDQPGFAGAASPAVERTDGECAGWGERQPLRHAGDYAGPVIFYVARVTPNRLRRAEERGAEGVTGDPEEPLARVAAVARRLREHWPVLPVRPSEMDLIRCCRRAVFSRYIT